MIILLGVEWTKRARVSEPCDGLRVQDEGAFLYTIRDIDLQDSAIVLVFLPFFLVSKFGQRVSEDQILGSFR